MYITVVEDDHLQAEWIESRLKTAFRKLIVKRINTESDFYLWLDEIENGNEKPDLFIIDVMLRWADPSPTMSEPPPEVIKNGVFRAGLRCKDQVLANSRTKDVPIILYTVLEESDLGKALENRQPGVTYLRKDSSPEPLIRMIRRILRANR
jgi:CheY-like chemotaxis protein